MQIYRKHYVRLYLVYFIHSFWTERTADAAYWSDGALKMASAQNGGTNLTASRIWEPPVQALQIKENQIFY